MVPFRVLKKEKLNPVFFNDWLYDLINDYTKRYEVYYGGGGSGKSYGAVQKMVIKARFNKRRVLVVRKVSTTLKISIYELFRSILIKTDTPFKENKTEMTLTLNNGSTFLFKGLDDSEKIKSITDITDIMIEEATELTEDDFTQLDIRLRPLEARYPQIYMMFNPISKANWCYKHWFLKEPNAQTRIIHTTYLDNKFLTSEYRLTLENLIHTNPVYYKIYCLGEFATLDKLIFPHVQKRLISNEETQGLKLFIGLDFGYINDPSALVYGFYDKTNKTIYITGEYFKSGMLNNEIADTIKALGLQKEIITADSAEQKSIAEIKRCGVYRIRSARKGKDSVMHGIQWLSQHHIIVDERCINLIEEFENYTWKKDKQTNEYINIPTDLFNHGIDALRYGLEQEQRANSVSALTPK